MKKGVSLFLGLLLVFLFQATAFAADDVQKATLKEKFEGYMLSLRDYYPDYYYQPENYWYWFEEKYSYYTTDNATDIPDYILVEGGFSIESPAECYYAFDKYIVLQGNIYSPDPLGMFLYSVKDDKFFSFTSSAIDPEVRNAIIEEYVCKHYFVKLIGDADGDNDLTILDATKVQRIIANLCVPHPYDSLPEIGYPKKLACVSDMDRDGERTILDATAIQRNLAGLTTEI